MDDEEHPTPRATVIQTVFDAAVFLVFIPVVAVTIGVVSILNARDAQRAAGHRALSARRDHIDTTVLAALPPRRDQETLSSGCAMADVS